MLHTYGHFAEGLSHEDLRSWHLNRAALANARTNWAEATFCIERNLTRMREAGCTSPFYIDRCMALMMEGFEAMQDAFLALTDEGQVLRSVHPFGGLLSQDERLEIIRRTSRHPQNGSGR